MKSFLALKQCRGDSKVRKDRSCCSGAILISLKMSLLSGLLLVAVCVLLMGETVTQDSPFDTSGFPCDEAFKACNDLPKCGSDLRRLSVCHATTEKPCPRFCSNKLDKFYIKTEAKWVRDCSCPGTRHISDLAKARGATTSTPPPSGKSVKAMTCKEAEKKIPNCFID